MGDDDRAAALAEFRRCAFAYIVAKPGTEKAGRRYALEMAAAELGLLGLDPERVTPEGYDDAEPAR